MTNASPPRSRRSWRARGLTRDDAHPDVYVIVRQTFDTKPRYTIYGSPWGYGYGWGYPGFYGYDWNPWYTTVEVKDITVGTLTVDLQDVASNQLVWRGISVKRVHHDVEAVACRETDQSSGLEDVREVSPDSERHRRAEPVATGRGGDGGRL